VDGLAPAEADGGKRFALIAKNHHALVDGISGVDLATVLLEPTAERRRPAPAGLRAWRPQPPPDALELLEAGARDGLRSAIGIAGAAAKALTTPGRSAAAAMDAGAGLRALLGELVSPAPRTPLNVAIGPRRRLRVVSQRLDDYRSVKQTCGVTVNDVVLTVVAGALGDWLRARALDTEGLELRALVPVSLRGKDERGTLGNRLALIRGPLPVGVTDPLRRLRQVSEGMNALKRSNQAVGAAALAAMSDRLPPAVLAQASRLQFSPWLFNLLVTNIPGPQAPLYLHGRRLTDLIPVAFLPEGHALAIAVMSYDGQIAYGLLGDHGSLPDMDLIASGIERSLAQLLAGAGLIS
jgi:diacylglycerol O-acyltransferase